MRHLVFSSFQFAWLSSIVFSPCPPFSKLSSFSCFLCSSDFSCSTSSKPASHHSCSARRTSLFRRSRTRLCVLLHHQHAFPPAQLESSAQCSCSRCTIPAVRTTMFPSSGGQRSFDFSVQELHVALLAVPDENQVSHLLPHVSEYCLLPAILTVFAAFVLVTPSFRLGQILLAAPESTVISTNCVHLDNLYSTFGWIQHTKLLARVRIRRPMCLLQSIARLLLRTLGEPVITSSRILLNPSRRSSRILLKPVASSITNFCMIHRVGLHVPRTWIGTHGGRCLLPLPGVPHIPSDPHSSDFSILLWLKLSSTSSAVGVFLLDTSDSPPTLCRLVSESTARPTPLLGITSFSNLPKVLPCVQQICLSVALAFVPAFPLALAFPSTFHREVSHIPNVSIPFETRPHIFFFDDDWNSEIQGSVRVEERQLNRNPGPPSSAVLQPISWRTRS